MAKRASGKPTGGSAAKSKGGPVSAAEHRKIAETLYAKARIHSAKADLAEALQPAKRTVRGYPTRVC